MKHQDFYLELKVAVYNNSKEVPMSFIDTQVEKSTVTYLSPNNNIVTCTITTPEGINSTGIAIYNDSLNKSITELQAMALVNAKDGLKPLYGAISRLFL